MLTRIVQAVVLIVAALAYVPVVHAQCGPSGCPPQGGGYGGEIGGYGGQQGGYIMQPGLVGPSIIQPGGGGQQQQPFDPGGNDPRFPPGAAVPGTPAPGTPAPGTPAPGTPGTTPPGTKPQIEPDCCEKILKRFDAIDKKLKALEGKSCQCDNDELIKQIKELQIAVKNQTGSIASLAGSQESLKKTLDGYDAQLKAIQIALKNSAGEVTKSQEAYYQKLTQTLSGGMRIRLQLDPNTGQVTQLPSQ
jgi:hypothetical protein